MSRCTLETAAKPLGVVVDRVGCVAEDSRVDEEAGEAREYRDYRPSEGGPTPVVGVDADGDGEGNPEPQGDQYEGVTGHERGTHTGKEFVPIEATNDISPPMA